MKAKTAAMMLKRAIRSGARIRARREVGSSRIDRVYNGLASRTMGIMRLPGREIHFAEGSRTTAMHANEIATLQIAARERPDRLECRHCSHFCTSRLL